MSFKVLFCTLSPESHHNCYEKLCEWSRMQSNLTIALEFYELPLAKLRNGTSFPPLAFSKMVIICHEMEVVVNQYYVFVNIAQGRTLLTDDDGLYNSFLNQACSATQGNIVFLLNGDNIPHKENSICDNNIINDLVSCGQTSIDLIYRSKRYKRLIHDFIMTDSKIDCSLFQIL